MVKILTNMKYQDTPVNAFGIDTGDYNKLENKPRPLLVSDTDRVNYSEIADGTFDIGNNFTIYGDSGEILVKKGYILSKITKETSYLTIIGEGKIYSIDVAAEDWSLGSVINEGDLSEAIDGYATEQWVENKNYITNTNYASHSKAGIILPLAGGGINVTNDGKASVDFPVNKLSNTDKNLNITSDNGTWNVDVNTSNIATTEYIKSKLTNVQKKLIAGEGIQIESTGVFDTIKSTGEVNNVDDVKVNGVSVVDNKIANIPIPDVSTKADKTYVDSELKKKANIGDVPSEYIKSASISDNTLTLVNNDESSIEFTPQGVTDYDKLANIPIKNLDLTPYDINNPISLRTIGEGAFIVTSNGYVATQGGYKKIYGKGTELIVVETNKNGVATLCMTVQDGANFYRIDDDISSSSDVRAWLSSNNKTTIINNDNASKVPTSGAVMNYVTEIVNNAIADVSALIGIVSENEVVE